MTAKTADLSSPEVAEETEEIDEILQVARDEKLVVAGVECRVARLRTREVFRLLRILSRAQLTGGLLDLVVQGELDQDELGARMVGALIVALPEAENDAVELIGDLVVIPDHTDADQKRAVMEELRNPDLDVTRLVIQTIIDQEAGELVSLGKAAAAWWKVEGPRIKAKAKASTDSDG